MHVLFKIGTFSPAPSLVELPNADHYSKTKRAYDAHQREIGDGNFGTSKEQGWRCVVFVQC